MRRLFLILGLILAVSVGYSQDKIQGGDANELAAGIGGTDKYIGTGSEVTFNKEIAGFCVVGEDSILVTVIKEGTKYDSGTAVASGTYNYLDNSIWLQPNETYIFNKYVIKMTWTTGKPIMVNYRR